MSDLDPVCPPKRTPQSPTHLRVHAHPLQDEGLSACKFAVLWRKRHTAYDADHLRQAIAAKGALAVIPNDPSRALKYPLVFLISAYAAGFLILAGLFGFGFFRLDDKFDKLADKLTDKMDKLSGAGVRSDTKLEDLLQRIPPVVVSAPKR
jgi:hypothetical protein